MKRTLTILLLAVGVAGIVWGFYGNRKPNGAYADLETKLTPLATKLGKPQPGEWLDRHPDEPGPGLGDHDLPVGVAEAFSAWPCALKVRVSANSPSLWPTMFSVT